MNYIIEKDSLETYDRIAADVGEDRIMRYRADVADREQVKSMFDAVIERFGRVDILVNFAGINRDAFLALVQNVYTENADRVGGMAMIEEVAEQ